ncbi:MAG TPA: hypothetical protein PLL17_08015 [Defluviitaleaceae bacterium]|nr:hypothetical protein [Candidatus Epulonipiscium sp.]HOQ16556.1 hypothetical protein [Defluviitaleaceae bacterium]HPT76205.1 hypothetical protein [Defluviitaleaceae bacterium]HQD51053.1 hypothetical protein [Defluviitaleaceae bacterium]
MNARTQQRHYRVAQKEIEHAPNKGIFIENDKKQLYAIIAGVILVLTFIQGLIIGLFISRD